MGWDDDDFMSELDDYDYVNKLGIYEEDEEEDQENELEDELYLAGLDPDDLDSMDEDERREALEDAGLDPNDYDDFLLWGSHGSSRTKSTYHSSSSSSSYTTSSVRNTSTPKDISTPYQNRTSTSAKQSTTSTYQRNTQPTYNRPVSSSTKGKWGVLEFIGVMIIIAILGFAVAAFGGQLLGAIVVIIIGIFILSRF